MTGIALHFKKKYSYTYAIKLSEKKNTRYQTLGKKKEIRHQTLTETQQVFAMKLKENVSYQTLEGKNKTYAIKLY